MNLILEDAFMKDLSELEDSVIENAIDRSSPMTLSQLSIIAQVRQAAKRSVFDMVQIPKDGAVIFRIPLLFVNNDDVSEMFVQYMDYLKGLGVHGVTMVDDILAEAYNDKQEVIDKLRSIADQLESVHPVGKEQINEVTD